MVVLGRDITRRKTAEHENEQSQQMLYQTQKMESIGNLVGGIAHDFNNILTAINGYAQLAQMKVRADSDLWHDIGEIQKAADRAANLTRQLLGFSRKQMIVPKIISINTVIKNTEKMLGRLISEDIRLETDLGKRIGNICADPGQLEQIIMNLVVNARDAIRSQPDKAEKIIRISTSQVFLDESYTDDHPGSSPGWHLQLQVEDSGCGISEDIRRHIFEPFYTTKGVGEGTGMGLATVYGIVKQNNGCIYVYSEPGQGATFKVYWPLIAAEDAAEILTEVEPELARGGSEVILLAEDDQQIRNICRRQLQKAGYTVIEAADGKEALEQARSNQGNIDLLFTDAVMPLMGGKELSEKIKDIYPDIPVLFTSGYMDNGIHQDIINLSGDRFISKPYNIQKVMVKIRQVLDNSAS